MILIHKRFQILLLALAVSLASSACVTKAKPSVVTLSSGATIEARKLRILTYELTNRLSGRVEGAAHEIFEKAEERSVKRAALEW